MDCNDPRGPKHILGRMGLILKLLGTDNAAEGCRRIEKLISDIGCPTSLQCIGIETDAQILQIVNGVNEQRLSNNPRRSNSETLLELLKAD